MNSGSSNLDTIRVFISYSQRDLDTADRLVSALESEGFDVTIDRRDLPYGEEWLKELADFIAGCDTVVALVSPAFIASKACNWELDQVQATNKRLVPVVIKGVPIEDLPVAIGKIQLLPAAGVFDLETHLKPLADVLNTDRAWIKEHTRLADRARHWIARDRAAALLLRGSALADAGRWRDRQPKAAPPPSDDILELMRASRRAATRRQRAVVAGSLLAALIAFALAGAAAFEWQRAETSYAAARTNFDRLIKDLAAEMQNTEGMPASTVRRILQNGEMLAANLKDASGGDPRLEASRGAMFYEFGKTYQKIGQRNDAIKASDQSLAIRRGLTETEPRNPEYSAALAESVALAGDLEREQKQFVKARELYGQSAKIASALNAKNPGNTDTAVNLSKTLIRLGDLDRVDKNFPEAKARYIEAFEATQRVIHRSKEEPPLALKRELTWNYNKLGDVSADLKDYAAAGAFYEKGLCIREYLLSHDQANTQLRHDISWSFDKIAGTRLQSRDFEGALAAQFASLAMRRRLIDGDPKNVIWRRDAAAALNQIGEIKAEAGDVSAAISFFIAAAEARLALRNEIPGDPSVTSAFEASTKRAKELRAKKLEVQAGWEERPYREEVAEDEQAAAAKARSGARDPASCWHAILADLQAKTKENKP